MARCERGYLCSVCGAEVEEITEESRVTRGYVRLRELAGAGLPIWDYPLPEFKTLDRSRAGETQI